MPAYAVAHMRQVAMGPPIVEYLERIDAGHRATDVLTTST